jgi:hypothetical protein
MSPTVSFTLGSVMIFLSVWPMQLAVQHFLAKRYTRGIINLCIAGLQITSALVTFFL